MLNLTLIFLGTMTVTSYRSVPAQTDKSPYYTSTGERCNVNGAAISQDRLCKACRRLHKRCKQPNDLRFIHYGDIVIIENIGTRIINDCMGKFKHYKIQTKYGKHNIFKKQNNWIDIWVKSYNDEHEFHKQYGIKLHSIYTFKENL